MKALRSRLPEYALWLSLALLAWFAIAMFFTKWGILGWKTGFGFMTVQAGPILLAIVGLAAFVALILALIREPRTGWWKAALALFIPAGIFAGLLYMQARGADAPPIHDVSTDLTDPPRFSSRTMAERVENEANPPVDYGIPLGQLEQWQGRLDEQLAIQTHADLIAENYGSLRPVPLGSATPTQALDAIVAAMGEIGLQDVRRYPREGIVEGVAETFAYGFRDDVVVRVRDGRIDMRSASRVGLSDLGYNAARLEDLRDAIGDRLEVYQDANQ